MNASRENRVKVLRKASPVLLRSWRKEGKLERKEEKEDEKKKIEMVSLKPHESIAGYVTME